MCKILQAVLILFILQVRSQDSNTNITTVPFTLTENGHIVINAQVNGIEGKFIFDTGSGMNLLTKKFANKIKDLKKTDHFTTGHRATGEEIKSDIWNSNLLKIACFQASKEIFAVYDFPFPLDGLISLTPFKDRAIGVDFEK